MTVSEFSIDELRKRVHAAIFAHFFVRECVCVWGGGGTRARECACAHVTLLIQHATSQLIVICDPSGSTNFFRHYKINGKIFRKKKKVPNITCVF
jgi:protein involved in ribonucleotide reduction